MRRQKAAAPYAGRSATKEVSLESNSDIELIDHLTKRPEMFVGSSSFDCVTSFLCGCDSAKNSNFLIGFQEWLTMRIGFGHNLLVNQQLHRRRPDAAEVEFYGVIIHLLH